MRVVQRKLLKPGVHSISKAFPFSERAICWLRFVKTGPIDGNEKECLVQLRVHLRPPSRALKRALSASSVFRPCCCCDVWNPPTPAPQLPGLFHSPRLPPTILSHLHLKCSCWGPKGRKPSGQDTSLFGLPPSSQTKSEAPLCKDLCCLVIMLKRASSAEDFLGKKIK